MSIKTFAFAAFMMAAAVFAAENKNAAKQSNERLIKLGDTKAAFADTIKRRQILVNYINQEKAKLSKVDEKTKKTIESNLSAARQNLSLMGVYMDVVFGIGNRREYMYDPKTDMISLKVGTSKDAFARTVNRKNAIAAIIADRKKALENEKDSKKAEALKAQLSSYERAFAILENALFAVYKVHPKRQYSYDQKSGILYLKSNKQEVEKLTEELNKLKSAEKAADPKEAEKAAGK